ncbi:GerAB/ArcD/ProY family transporter [Paenibacillus sp. FSL K6-2524]|uniref:GerAB/ArcD/ProY family transporter n=1 Tax=Paenibacillus sp. FSL K6-2524 TaxID=2954516 RepID=UPI0030F9FF44
MNNNRPITTIQVVAVIVSTIIGIGILSFPRYMVEAAESAAPLVAASGIIIAFLSCWFTASVCRKFPDENLFVFSRRLLGTGIADFFSVLILLFFAISTGITIRQFGEVCITVVFRKTPIEAVILIMLLMTALSIRRNIIKFTYIHSFYLPFILLSILSITLIAMKNVDLLNLLPLTGNYPSLSSLSKGMFYSASLYQGTFILILLVPLMKKPKQVLKAGSIALVFIGVIYMLIVIVSLGLFGAQETKLLFYPTLETARSISIGSGLLERFDAIFIIVWVVSVFTSLFTNYYLTAYSFREITRFKDHRLISNFLLPFIFVVSLLPRDVYQVNNIASTTAHIGLVLLTFYPLLLWLTAIIRKKGGVSHE